MDTTPRVSPQEAREKLQSGEALLVCAYDDDEKYRTMRLEGARSLRQFKELEPSLPKEKEIIFYCG